MIMFLVSVVWIQKVAIFSHDGKETADFVIRTMNCDELNLLKESIVSPLPKRPGH